MSSGRPGPRRAPPCGAVASWSASTRRARGVSSSRSSTMRIHSICAASSGSAMALSRPAPMSITRNVAVDERPRLGRAAVRDVRQAHGGRGRRVGQHLEHADRLDRRRATSWLQVTVRTSGSRNTSAIDQAAAASAAGSSSSMAIAARPSAVVGNALDAHGECDDPRAVAGGQLHDGVETLGVGRRRVQHGAPLQTSRPASMAARLVVSSDSGTSTASCTACTIHGMTSWPSFRCGPMLRSRTRRRPRPGAGRGPG